MDILINNHKRGGTIFSQKLYTQKEVDDLIREKVDSSFAIKKSIKEEIQNANRQKKPDDRVVADLVKKSNRILVSISSHKFPFDFFPDTINIEEGRITIIKRHLLLSQVHSIDLKDISNVFINTIFISSQLVIISKTFEENEIKIKNLRPKEAIFARRIIEGLRIFVSKQINTSNYAKEELISKLKELSTTKIVM